VIAPIAVARTVFALFWAAVFVSTACPVGVAQNPLPFDPLGSVNAALGSPITVAASVEPAAAEKPATLVVTATLEEGWHLYAVTQKPGGPKATRITVDATSPWQPSAAFVPDEAPHVRTITDVPAWAGLQVEEHEGTVVWRAPLATNPEGKATQITGSVSVQMCRETSCSPPASIPFVADMPAGAAKAPPTAPPAPAVAGATDPFSAAVALPGATTAVIATHIPPRAHSSVEAAFGAARSGVDGAGTTSTWWPLIVRLSPDAGYHLYAPAGSADSDVGQGKPTVVSVADRAASVVVLGATPSHSPELAAANGVDGPVTFEVLLPESAAAAAEVVIGFQTCTETSCDPPTAVRIAAPLPPQATGPESGIEFLAAKYAEAAKKPVPVQAAPAAVVPAPTAGGRSANVDLQPTPSVAFPQAVAGPSLAGPSIAAAAPLPVDVPKPTLSLPMALLSGLIGGLILNLMPCVLPVLGLKLMSFAQQSGKARAEVFRTNLWYCAGVYAVFFALATASVAANIGLGSRNLAWGEQFTSSTFNITMAAIVFAFALSFLGVWELPIPGFIGEKAGHLQSKEGPLGAFLKGVLSTVLATPCSGPFLGPVFGFTLSQPTYVTYGVFGAIATGMALPYILVGLIPGLVKFLPKPGLWMETLKEILGFVMLGTVVFLFTFLKHDWFVPTFALLVGIWAACWWIGKGQEKSGGPVGFGRWVQAAGVAAAIGFAAFTFLGPVESIIPWEPFSRARLAELRSNGATVLVDFSADWCMTCKLNLATAIETDKVKAAIESNKVVPLLADWTEESPEIKTMLESLQSKSIPVLAIFPAPRPGESAPEPIILRDLITESQVLTAIKAAGPSRAGAPRAAAAPARKSH
jgi:thiol:disulfide interchange protein